MQRWLGVGMLALALVPAAAAQEQASIVIVVDGGPVDIAGQSIPPEEFARESVFLNSDQIVVPAGTTLMAYFPAEAAKLALIVVGPAELGIQGGEIALRSGTLMLSSDTPTDQQLVALFLTAHGGGRGVLCRAAPRGDLYVAWDGQALLDVAYDGEGDADLQTTGGRRILHRGQRLMQRGTMIETGDAAAWRADRNLHDAAATGMRLSLQAAKQTRAQRQKDLFGTVINWDRWAQAELVRTSEKGKGLGLRPIEVRQVVSMVAPRSPLSGVAAVPTGAVVATQRTIAGQIFFQTSRRVPEGPNPANLNRFP